MNIFLRRVVFTAAMAGALLPSAAFAVSPSFDSLCFTKEECIKARGDQFGIEPEEAVLGWIKDTGNCQSNEVEEWGKCLPAGVTAAEVSFGGKTQFLHIGDYINTFYKYGIGVAAILAVIMIIVAGVQWVISGGNSEVITASKKRIGGAIIGLLLAYFSYAILNTINPALVNLQLPQVWMVKNRPLMPEYCRDLDASQLLALAGQSTREITTLPDNVIYGTSPKEPKGAPCGSKYFVQGGGASTCEGSYCENGGVCMPEGKKDGDYRCVDARIAGSFFGVYVVEPGCAASAIGLVRGWEFPYVTLLSGIHAQCKSKPDGRNMFWVNSKATLEPPDEANRIQRFKITATEADVEKAVDFCGGKEGLLGYYFIANLDYACGGDQYFAIGRGGYAHFFGFPGDSFELNGRYTEFPSNRLFSFSDLQNGILLNIDVTNISPRAD